MRWYPSWVQEPELFELSEVLYKKSGKLKLRDMPSLGVACCKLWPPADSIFTSNRIVKRVYTELVFLFFGYFLLSFLFFQLVQINWSIFNGTLLSIDVSVWHHMT